MPGSLVRSLHELLLFLVALVGDVVWHAVDEPHDPV